MINLGIALGLAALVATALRLAGFGWVAVLVPATLAFAGAFVVLGRRTMLRVQALFTSAQEELQSINPNAKELEKKNRVDRVVKLLESGLQYSRWQFLVEQEIHGQIGIIKYLFRDHEGAKASLTKANPRNYLAHAMLGALAYQAKDYPRSGGHFENAIKFGKKEGLMYAAYAWCLMQQKERDKAIAVLGRGVAANPSDEKLKGALTALQNDKKLKMSPWEPMWWQLGLELPKMQQPMMAPRGRAFRGMR